MIVLPKGNLQILVFLFEFLQVYITDMILSPTSLSLICIILPYSRILVSDWS